jgi:hypothetical protein
MYTYDKDTETIDFNSYGMATPFTVLKPIVLTVTVRGEEIFKYPAVPGLWTVVYRETDRIEVIRIA